MRKGPNTPIANAISGWEKNFHKNTQAAGTAVRETYATHKESGINSLKKFGKAAGLVALIGVTTYFAWEKDAQAPVVSPTPEIATSNDKVSMFEIDTKNPLNAPALNHGDVSLRREQNIEGVGAFSRVVDDETAKKRASEGKELKTEQETQNYFNAFPKAEAAASEIIGDETADYIQKNAIKQDKDATVDKNASNYDKVAPYLHTVTLDHDIVVVTTNYDEKTGQVTKTGIILTKGQQLNGAYLKKDAAQAPKDSIVLEGNVPDENLENVRILIAVDEACDNPIKAYTPEVKPVAPAVQPAKPVEYHYTAPAPVAPTAKPVPAPDRPKTPVNPNTFLPQQMQGPGSDGKPGGAERVTTEAPNQNNTAPTPVTYPTTSSTGESVKEPATGIVQPNVTQAPAVEAPVVPTAATQMTNPNDIP